ncbi:MAG: hypothetical protein GY711_00240 [bacterium]|nr:hypothetical protein [bacterium]
MIRALPLYLLTALAPAAPSEDPTARLENVRLWQDDWGDDGRWYLEVVGDVETEGLADQPLTLAVRIVDEKGLEVGEPRAVELVPRPHAQAFERVSLRIAYDDLGLAAGRHALFAVPGLYRRGARTPLALAAPLAFTHVVRLNARASIEDVSINHLVRRYGELGMAIEVRHELTGLADRPLELGAYFFASGGAPLVDRNGRYRTHSGQVSTGRTIEVRRDDLVTTTELFLPYAELEESHDRPIGVAVALFDLAQTDSRLAQSEPSFFRVPGVQGPGSVDVGRVWFEHNVVEMGKTGLRVHAELELVNLEDLRCTARVRFGYRGGSPLRDVDGECAVDGQVALETTLTPTARTARRDLVFFLPYEQLHVREVRAVLVAELTVVAPGVAPSDSEPANVFFEYSR